jgi:bifunctional UDP-N-acetylglucosamine pyrophosphorylase / glucosamine-1-phosphate N-acetyltransferase
MQNIRTIILAAGKGTRMKSDIPKVLHKICGQPIIEYILDVAKAVGSLKTYVVLGHKSRSVKEYLNKDVVIIEQTNQRGTADAIKCTQRYLRGYRGDILVLCGDTPLLNKTVTKSIVKKHRKSTAVCTFLTAVLHNSQGYGRIIRDENGRVVAIREERDAVGYERDIAEINVGVYCFRSQELFNVLKEIRINKKKKEFYLTDIIELFSEKGLKVDTIETEDPSEGLGVNTREDLAIAESILRRRILKDFMLQGVTIQRYRYSAFYNYRE